MKINGLEKFKNSIVTCLGLYPTIIIISLLLKDWLVSLNLYTRSFMLTVIVVPLMVYFIIPFLNNVIRSFFRVATNVCGYGTCRNILLIKLDRFFK